MAVKLIFDGCFERIVNTFVLQFAPCGAGALRIESTQIASDGAWFG